MKTIFNTDEEKLFLNKLLHRGVMFTDNILESDYGMSNEYILHKIEFRRECFRCLGERDPNHDYINYLEDTLNDPSYLQTAGHF